MISWSSKKQYVVSRSNTEAEYQSLAHLATDLLWIQSLLSDLHLSLPQPLTIWCDNLSAVHLRANPVLHARAKHVEIDIYFVRDLVLQKKLFVCHLPASQFRVFFFPYWPAGECEGSPLNFSISVYYQRFYI